MANFFNIYFGPVKNSGGEGVFNFQAGNILEIFSFLVTKGALKTIAVAAIKASPSVIFCDCFYDIAFSII